MYIHINSVKQHSWEGWALLFIQSSVTSSGHNMRNRDYILNRARARGNRGFIYCTEHGVNGKGTGTQKARNIDLTSYIYLYIYIYIYI